MVSTLNNVSILLLLVYTAIPEISPSRDRSDDDHIPSKRIRLESSSTARIALDKALSKISASTPIKQTQSFKSDPKPHRVPQIPKASQYTQQNTKPAEPYHNYTFQSECVDIIMMLPLIPGIDKDALTTQCQSRFIYLTAQHQIHQILINQHAANIYGDFDHNEREKSHLIILDLDETIMDQRSFTIPLDEMHYNKKLNDIGDPSYWQNINAKELIVSINNYQARYNRPKKEFRYVMGRRVLFEMAYQVSIGIFRKDFMRFIAYTQTQINETFDIMLYSMAISPLLIYHAVTMEMYYNYVYVPRKGLKRPFMFKFVIGRAEDQRFSSHKLPKNMEYLMRMIGDNGGILQRYKHIVILDDMRNKVWSPFIPGGIIERKINTTCYAPFPFAFKKKGQDGTRFTDFELTQIKELRSIDTTFEQFIKMIQGLSKPKEIQKQLNWRHWIGVNPFDSARDSYMS